jgi:transcriptional regulator with XRE-family HTH domain
MSKATRSTYQVIGDQIRLFRDRRGWTQEELAAQVEELGVPMSNVTVARIEKAKGRKVGLSVEELLAFAAVLGVSPKNLLTPGDKGARLRLFPTIDPVDAELVRAWIRGENVLFDDDSWRTYSEAFSEEEWEALGWELHGGER